MLAAVHETGLLAALEDALPTGAVVPARLAKTRPTTRRQSLLTLLFLGVVGLRRICSLRSYTGDALALLTGRRRVYGFWWVERFLSQLARAGGAEALTDALAEWTAQLWQAFAQEPGQPPPAFYADGHKKPVYSDHLIPRGLIGRTGKVLGCRALMLLHDAAGHPLLATTHRGDLHLTAGTPQIVACYEQHAAPKRIARLIVDREGMAAEFLATLVAAGRTVITILRTDQYQNLTTFTDVGAFVPLCRDQKGAITREVAPARFALPLPDHPGQTLPLAVALIRDWRSLQPQVAVATDEEEAEDPPRWDADLKGEQRCWWAPEWVATPAPAPTRAPKLIPIVTTAREADPIALVRLYSRRWPAQENVIKDWLLPLGLDTNHGYRRTVVENSEEARRRSEWEQRLARLQRWAVGAGERATRASALYQRRWKEARAHGQAAYEALNDHAMDLRRAGVEPGQRERLLKDERAKIDAELAAEQDRMWQAYHRSHREQDKCEHYRREQRALLRKLADLAASERTMYELEQAKDQIMSVFKLALTNLVMWARDHYFPASYAHATWHRLAPFFRLPGRVVWGTDRVEVELHAFNDRRLNRDLAVVCAQVNAAQARLPDGRQLQVRLSGARRECAGVQGTRYSPAPSIARAQI